MYLIFYPTHDITWLFYLWDKWTVPYLTWDVFWTYGPVWHEIIIYSTVTVASIWPWRFWSKINVFYILKLCHTLILSNNLHLCISILFWPESKRITSDIHWMYFIPMLKSLEETKDKSLHTAQQFRTCVYTECSIQGKEIQYALY
jgi:hypothetical protein